VHRRGLAFLLNLTPQPIKEPEFLGEAAQEEATTRGVYLGGN
jgi:hypothetical protein